MDNTSPHEILRNAFIWWIGWFSLFLIEAVLWLSTSLPPLYPVLLGTLLVYSLVGIISGFVFGMIAPVLARMVRSLKEPDRLNHLSMAACISAIIFFYVLSFPARTTPLLFLSPAVLKGMLLLFLPLAALAGLLFCIRWMAGRGDLMIAYLALLPSLWLFTSLKLNVSRELFPSLLQITNSFRTVLLLFGSLFLFFLGYLFISLIRRTFKQRKTPAIISLVVISLLLIFVFFLKKGDYQQQSNKTQIASAESPNVVLITLDTVRADHLSCYGYQRLTSPNLDRFSREGVVFKNAYAANSWTLPSHASIFTGLYPSKHRADHKSDSLPDPGNEGKERSVLHKIMFRGFTKLPDEIYTLAEILSERGYRTAGIIGGIFCNSIFGLDQGFHWYDDEIPYFNIEFFLVYKVIERVFSLQDLFTQYGYLGKRIAADLNNSAFKWLEKNYEQPFFLFINYMDAHTPYLPPPPYDRHFGKDSKDIIVSRYAKGNSGFLTAEKNLINAVNAGKHQLTPEEREHIVVLYDGGIRYLDHHLGLLFDKLKSFHAYDNTLIIITSDHGEAFGEHNQMEHGRTLYEEVLRVPLIIKYPSAYGQKEVVEKRISLVDLMPTILSFLGYPIPSGIDGQVIEHSNHPVLAELMMGIAKKSYQATRDLRAVYQDKEKYIWSSNGADELYNLEKDPREEKNLISQFPQRAEAMSMVLKQWLASVKLPDTEKESVRITKSTEEKLRALGYLK